MKTLETHVIEAHSVHPKAAIRSAVPARNAVRLSLRPKPGESGPGEYAACYLSEAEALELAHGLIGSVMGIKG